MACLHESFTGTSPGKSLLQWVGGSFVTNKPNLGDLDVVTFLPYTAYEPAEEALIEFYSTVNLHERCLDAYICPVYPTTHQRYNQYRQFRQDWQRLFESNR